jgi:hypothetical protein
MIWDRRPGHNSASDHGPTASPETGYDGQTRTILSGAAPVAKKVTFGESKKKPSGSDNFFWDVMSKSEKKWANKQARKARRRAKGGGS